MLSSIIAFILVFLHHPIFGTALAQSIEGGGSPAVTPVFPPIATSVTTYTGPGDVVTSAKAWYGLRAYSLSQTLGSTVALNLSRASDSHTCDILLNTSGQLGNTTNCSNGGDNGTAVASWCNATTCTVPKLYDQTAGNNCSAASCDLSQATLANQPTLTFNCVNSLPCLTGSGSQSLNGSNRWSFSQNFGNSLTLVGEGERTGNTSTNQIIIGGNGIDGNFTAISFGGAPNDFVMYAGNFVVVTASDNVLHSLIGVFGSTNSTAVVDGSATTGQDVGGDNLGDEPAVMGRLNNTESITGTWFEAGLWAFGFNATQYGNMNTNMTNYY